jgi:hypothetical protein
MIRGIVDCQKTQRVFVRGQRDSIKIEHINGGKGDNDSGKPEPKYR